MASPLRVKDIKWILQNSEFNPKVFVETGTFLGGTIKHVHPLFRESHTIEAEESLFNKVSKSNWHSVTFHLGDSPTILEHLLPSIDEPVFFFLDAHWFIDKTITTIYKGNEMPLLDELALIEKRPYADLIVIDDAKWLGKQIVDGPDWRHCSHEAIIKSLTRVRKWYIWNDYVIILRDPLNGKFLLGPFP